MWQIAAARVLEELRLTLRTKVDGAFLVGGLASMCSFLFLVPLYVADLSGPLEAFSGKCFASYRVIRVCCLRMTVGWEHLQA